ncbi:unnamed protein product [Owenia fusiformis]|uniref:Translocon-associated protein subunit alpha n=1 Tax=Owenia fusiformis TaxID=6347 RepID=A0A8J1Y925_OWEFU|nr:unnamed protein product [Owenia fusiformis]
MAKILSNFIFMMLLVLPTSMMLFSSGASMVAYAQEEDILEGEEEEEGVVEDDDEGTVDDGEDGETAPTETEGEEEEEEVPSLKASSDAETMILFTKPTGTTEFPAGGLIRFLVGFANKGEQDFIVESLDASFRYPQDYSFFIQNFTAYKFEKTVEPKRQATFEYGFTPSETFNARPFGLVINLNYRDAEGNYFQDAVFNETIQITEPDEGLDGETFFLYVLLAAIAVLLLVGAQQLVATLSKKTRGSKPKAAPVEMGTQNNSDVDYDWIPKENLVKHSPRAQTSPRSRRTKRQSGQDE